MKLLLFFLMVVSLLSCATKKHNTLKLQDATLPMTFEKIGSTTPTHDGDLRLLTMVKYRDISVGECYVVAVTVDAVAMKRAACSAATK